MTKRDSSCMKNTQTISNTKKVNDFFTNISLIYIYSNNPHNVYCKNSCL